MVSRRSVVKFDKAGIVEVDTLAEAEARQLIIRRDRLSEAIYRRIICAFAFSKLVPIGVKQMLEEQGLI